MNNLLKALIPITSRVRTDISAVKIDGKVGWRKNEPLTEERLKVHLSGGIARGVCPIKEGESTTKLALLDLDSHKGETSWSDMVAIAQLVINELEKRGIKDIPWRSSGGNGIHIFILWDAPQDAFSVREFLKEVLASLGYRNGTAGVINREIEIFPKQNNVDVGGCGNMFILPLVGKSVPLEPLLGLEPMDREFAVHLDWAVSPSVPRLERPVLLSQKPSHANGHDPNLKYLHHLLSYISPDIGYNSWIKVGMSLHHETDGQDDGLALWDEFSQPGASYPGYEHLENKWKSFHNNKDRSVTFGTIKHMAREAGWIEDALLDFDNLDANKEAQTRRFDLIPAAKFIEGKPSSWLIKKVLPKTGIAMIFGRSGSGKSFFALDIVAAIVRGDKWCGHNVKQGKAVYIAAEGADGFRKRVIAYARHYNIDLEIFDLSIIRDAPNLMLDEDRLLIDRIKENGDVSVIVIDTLAQVTAGANENSAEDMGLVLNRCKRIHNETGALVILIHHSGKDENRGARGWSGIRAAVDTEIEITITHAGVNRARITKQKDGDGGADFFFKLKSIILGTDEDDEEITSCVVEHLLMFGAEKKEPAGTESQRKREYIRNILSNAASMEKTQDDVVRLFLDWLYRYSELHFAVVAVIYKEPGITRLDMWSALDREPVREDSAEADLFKLLIRELSMGGIIRQHRETDYHGRFVKVAPKRTPKGHAGSTMTSAFEDDKPYVLTELGQQFVHYAMSDVPIKIGYAAPSPKPETEQTA